MVTEATILDLSEIEELVSSYEKCDSYDYVRTTLLNPTTHWFFSREHKVALSYIPQSRGRYEMHIYSKARGGRALRNWCISTGSYIFDEVVDANHLINWVSKDNKGLQFFMGMLGSSRVGEIEGDILYCINRKDRKEIENRVKI